MPKAKNLYLYQRSSLDHFEVTKWDETLTECLARYKVIINDHHKVCDCPSYKQPCKHLLLLHRILNAKGTGDFDYLYNPETDMFSENPTNELTEKGGLHDLEEL